MQQQQQQQSGAAEQQPPRRRRRKRKRRPQQQREQQHQREHEQPSHIESPSSSDIEQSSVADGSGGGDGDKQLAAARPTTYWRSQVADDPEALAERDGIVVSINRPADTVVEIPKPKTQQHPKPQPDKPKRWHDSSNRKEIVKGIVLRVDEVAVQSADYVPTAMPTTTSTATPQRETSATYNDVRDGRTGPDKAYRRPYSSKRDDLVDTNRPSSTIAAGAAALKNILKNSGGMSLSEILQQQNLSLDDLLKGKQNALQVLQSTTSNPSAVDYDASAMFATTKAPRKISLISNLGNGGVSTTTSTPVPPVQRPPIRRKPDDESSDDEKPTLRRLPIGYSKTTTTTAATLSPVTTATLPKTTTTTTAPTPDQSDDIDSEAIHIFGTMSSFLVPTNKNSNHSKHSEPRPTIRRIPITATERTKSIKEVVSAIRPDLHNSNTRRRLFKARSNQTTTSATPTSTTTSAIPASATSIPNYRQQQQQQRPESSNKLPPRFGSGYRLRPTEASDSGSDETTTIVPTDIPYMATDIPTENIPIQFIVVKENEIPTTQKPHPIDMTKEIIKSRLSLRPRLRPYSGPQPGRQPTTRSSPTVETTMPTVGADDDSNEEESTITTTFPSLTKDDDHSDHLDASHVNIQQIIAQYEPDINAIEQMPTLEEAAAESGISSMETIEDLFKNTFNSRDDNDDESPEAITSRVDSDAEPDSVESNVNENFVLSDRPPKRLSSDVDVTERNPSLFAEITSARTVDDRTDLLELLEDRRNGARLVKVLAQRNMTLSQLIAHRQRGSSQLHLSEIFLSKSGQPVAPPTAETLEDVVTAFENFPAFNVGNVRSIKPDDIRTDSQGSSYFTSIISIKPTDEALKEGRAMRPDEKATVKPAKTASTDFYKPWLSQNGAVIVHSPATVVTHRSIVLMARMGGGGGGPTTATTSTTTTTQPAAILPTTTRTPTTPSDDPIDVDSVYKGVEQLDTNADHMQDIVDMELSGHGFRRQSTSSDGGGTRGQLNPINKQLPMGVKSAIVASASIVGVSLFIFIVIFVACRWRQRRKKTFNYAENFQAVRSRLPILTARESSAHSSGSGSGEDLSKRSTSPPMVFHTLASAGGGGGGMGGMSGMGGTSRMSARGSKINTMDPNSPEVQEYLYDAMRKPFQ